MHPHLPAPAYPHQQPPFFGIHFYPTSSRTPPCICVCNVRHSRAELRFLHSHVTFPSTPAPHLNPHAHPSAAPHRHPTQDYREFIAATYTLSKMEKEDALLRAFRHFDQDGDGFITR